MVINLNDSTVNSGFLVVLGPGTLLVRTLCGPKCVIVDLSYVSGTFIVYQDVLIKFGTPHNEGHSMSSVIGNRFRLKLTDFVSEIHSSSKMN